jgi:signal transduction histidine kinase
MNGPANSSTLPDEVRRSYGYMVTTLIGYAAGYAVMVMLFWEMTPLSVTLPWTAAFAAMWIARLVMTMRFRRVTLWRHEDCVRWRRLWNLGSLSGGVIWGLTSWLFYLRGSGVQQTGLVVVVFTFCVAVVPVLSTQPKVYFTFVALVLIPLLARIVSVGDVDSHMLAGILLLTFSMTALLARNFRQNLQRIIELKLRADELLAQLRVEKYAAEEARREAEVANRAKTQFFTAASHDLRQPLHAMGLFAEALRQKNHDEEVAQLVNSINGSVDALEGLFSELLDITRIDTGGVEVHLQYFEVGDIQRKLRLNFEPMAFEKGLSLRMRGARHVVHADPLLVERILRNLVSNAIRYTNDGTVLVSARRRGEKVLLQVWDTGLGIRDHEQQRIFEEFYQVPSTAAMSPEQRKGLGLGLAIVKRLAALMNAPLSLRSEPGRGTVFTLELPAGKVARSPVSAVQSKGPLGITLDGRLIVVVEDEPAVRSGLEVLLKGWGATLASFDSVDGAMAWAASVDPAIIKPDLLIVDYRLENGLNGVDAIVSLRERFGIKIPAIMVTGSTMTSHDREAQDKDFHLLIKPVVPNKLRAMIAFKLAAKSG